MNVIYECAITGISADAGESGPLGTVPPGWFKVTFTRQLLNPKWVAIQQLKEAVVNNVLNQITKAEDREIQFVAVNLQVEAQFAALEGVTPKYTTQEETIYTAPPEVDSAIRDAFNEAREQFGLDPLLVDAPTDEPEEKEGNEAGQAEPKV